MRNASLTRDRYRLVVTGATVAAASAAIVATGWLAGAAAHQQAKKEAGTGSGGTLVPRPVETRVTTQYATDVAPTPPVGGGGTVAGDPQADPGTEPAPSTAS